MARITQAQISPKKRSNEEEEDSELSGSESDAVNDGEAANDGHTLHLGSDLPDIAPESGSSQISDEDMGNAGSKEDLTAAIQEEFKKRNAAQAAETTTTGKLKRPSMTANPPFRQPRPALETKKKQLAPTNKKRMSDYDQIDVDVEASKPNLPPPGTSVLGKNKKIISPTRAQRKVARQQASSPSQEREPVTPQRQSKRQQVRDEPVATPTDRAEWLKSSRNEELEAEAEGEAEVEAGAEEAEAEAETEAAYEEAQYRDFFPDAVVQQHQEDTGAGAEAHAGATEEEHGNDVEAAPEDQTATGRSPKRRGRPRNSNTSPQKQTSPQKKRGSGRPRKSDIDATLPTEPARNQEEPASKRRGRSSKEGTSSTQTPTEPQKKSARPTTKKKSAARPRDRQSEQASRKDDEVDASVFDFNDSPAASRPNVPNLAKMPDPLELYSPEKDDSPEKSTKSKKRKRSAEATAQANTAVKRRGRFDNTREQPESSDDGTNPNQHRLFGQWLPFKKAVRKLDEIGWTVQDGARTEHHDIDLTDRDVKASLKLCKEAEERFKKLKTHSGVLEPSQDPCQVLKDIDDRVDGLRGVNKEFPTDTKDDNKSTDIYFYLFPRLVKLVELAIGCYEAMDKDTVPPGQISMTHLIIVEQMIDLIVGLEKAAREYRRPATNLHIVQPVRETAVILKDVNKTFRRHIQIEEVQIQRNLNREAQARETALRLEEEERQQRQRARLERLEAKWEKLHEERLWAEGGFPSSHKRLHLANPRQYHHHFTETDQNGYPFERAEVFYPRVGPPPALVEAAAAQEWSLVELSSLCDGLKQYAGQYVFERIFRKYCGMGRELNRYNVTEIVTTAAGLKEKLTEIQSRNDGAVEDWVKAIPVWTKPHAALGKENDGGESVVDVAAAG